MTEKQKQNIIIIGAFILMFLLWWWSWYYIDNSFPLTGNNDPETYSIRGAFGDKFGFINSFFSGVALVGIVLSIYFQRKELSLQREELIETRKEFKDQNFQTTLFNLLKSQREIVKDLKYTVYWLKSYSKESSKIVDGHDFFMEAKGELKRIKEALEHTKHGKYESWGDIMEYHSGYEEIEPQSEEEEYSLTLNRKHYYTSYVFSISKETWESYKSITNEEKVKLIYTIYLNRNQFVIGHYFRHLYHILKFLNEQEAERKLNKSDNEKNEIIKEFLGYANFAQAQMSIPELFLIYYNCLTYPKLKELVIKYGFVENLNIENLLAKEHYVIKDIKLKTKLNV